MAFTLTSPSFEAGGAIPRRFTCDGADLSPALAWEGAPATAAAFALIVDDPDARGFVHWVAYNLAGSVAGRLAEGAAAAPGAPAQGRNDFGRIGYGGPCPPSGTHRYVFTLLALARPLSLPGGPSAAQVRSAAREVTIGEAVLGGTYTRRR